MTQFLSLKEAINYQPFCPLCKKHTVIDGRYGVESKSIITWDFRERTLLTWCTPTDEITIDLETEVIESHIMKKNSTPVYGANFSGSVSTKMHIPIANGLMYVRLGVGCEDCCQYSYVVQIIIDLTHNRIVGLPLNSEVVTIEDSDGTTHEIKNVYTTEKTEYAYFRVENQEGTLVVQPYHETLTLPLVPLDLSDPRKTLERIRGLIVFS